MKCFLDSRSRRIRFALRSQFSSVPIGGAIAAMGELPSWIRNVEANSALEAVFFRMMSLPDGAVAFRRPPRETRPALGELIKSNRSKPTSIPCGRWKTNSNSISPPPNLTGRHMSTIPPTRSVRNSRSPISMIAACALPMKSRLFRWLRLCLICRREAYGSLAGALLAGI